MMWKNQRCIFILSGLFWQRNRNALYFVCALYFVRRWPSLGAKFGIPDEFSPNCFPITPPRNGNIGNGYRDLLESGLKSAKIRRFQKKSHGEIFTKNKNNFFRTWLFSTFKSKNVIFFKRMCCWISLFIYCKNNFSKL